MEVRSPATRQEALVYLRATERARLNPNFFMTSDYLLLRGLEYVQDGGLVGFKEPGRSEWFVVPMNLKVPRPELNADVYAAPSNVFSGHSTFLDYEFIYNPLNFEDMKGKAWAVFRKNVRKWPRRSAPGGSLYRRLLEGEYVGEAASLFERWAGDRDIFDAETSLRFLIDGPDRYGLFRGSELVGVNVADYGMRYVHFRLCVDNGEEYLQEYLRWLFHRHAIAYGKWVNDGGALGSKGLYRYKAKLNPVEVRHIHSLRRAT